MNKRERILIGLEIADRVERFTAPQYDEFKRLLEEQHPELIERHPDLIQLMDNIRKS
jgi:hypothetical protein